MAEAIAADTAPAAVRRPHSWGGLAERYGLIAFWLVLIVLFGVLRPATFLSAANWQSILGSQSVLVLLALSLLIPMTAGDYDLSIAGVMGVSSMAVAVFNVQSGWPIWLAVLAALAVSAAAGLLNGALVVIFGVDPFISTLGTGTVFLGVVYWMSDSNTIVGISPDLVHVVVGLRLLGVPLAFYYGLGLCAIVWFVLRYTVFGRQMLFVGRNRSLSRLSGLRVGRLRWVGLVISALGAGVAGVAYVGTTGAADPTGSQAFLLPTFAAVFLGATTIEPRRFNAIGTLIAVYFLVTGITGLQLLGAQAFVQNLFFGGALVISVALSHFSRRREAEGDRLGHG
ncbi:ABC transporter permease [Phytohabitans sp. ZYX-F-186]|uniref:Autoinducer 2 import system permease protein LsrD n=1 Tax=Phytohabitans maris TaxID=3071409 RepID=A0ABU0ZW24_9ACTN|nr:ABC transporter permease [Phytohabitans sp. ZYX-F-186]MDQ7911223.1 ABC transporter permease [Phytohabitans sp. ZYX-F-186]